jgi:acyl dehydratase
VTLEPVAGRYFEDLQPGEIFDGAPRMTLTDGHAGAHQAIVGCRLRLCLDEPLAREVTARDEGDTLTTRVEVQKVTPHRGGGGTVDLRCVTTAHRPDSAPVAVLDWTPVVLMA